MTVLMMIAIWMLTFTCCRALLQAPQASPALRASLLVASAAGLDGVESTDYNFYVKRGMQRFKQKRVAESIEDFDQAIALNPQIAPYMWQRGLSLYYENRFEGAKQFRKDVQVNPNDTEEAIWTFLCEAQLPNVGFDGAQKQLLSIPNERRPVMRTVYNLFKGEATCEDVARSGTVSEGAFFYATLYLGLYSEAKGETDLAKNYINSAVKSKYGISGDYMWHLAAVHKFVRNW
mmetsp:Transcript_9639/g.12597  ORF Transcript_9639/g.12597 Transcript_9639/m.12597 type:complete len:233 (+) Transcript_9639:63-761(+)